MSLTCPYCKDQAPRLLDEDGIQSSVSGRPGRWGHANLDGFWACSNPPSPDPDPPPYLWMPELIAAGRAIKCDDDDCEGGVVLDRVCYYCGTEYPDAPMTSFPHEGNGQARMV